MRYCVFLLIVLLSLSLVMESQARRRARQKDERKKNRGLFNGRNSDRWWMRRFFRPRGWGGRHSFSFGAPEVPFSLDFSWDLGLTSEPWWKGPNVCFSESSDNSTADNDTITHYISTASQVCEESESSYRCTTTIAKTGTKVTKVEVYECCHGYTRDAGDFGCPEKITLTSLPELARTLGLNDFLRAVDSVGLREELARGNITVFAPADGTFTSDSGILSPSGGIVLQKDEPLMVSRPLQSKLESELQAVLLGHLLAEPRRVSSFRDEEVLDTGSPYGSTIRINFFSRPEKLTTANCVPVTSADNQATNGVIHVVEKVLPTVTSSLMDIIQSDEQYSFLKTAIARAGLVSTLQQPGQYTLLAPTNSAFQKLNRGLYDRLLAGDVKCLEKVLKHHLFPSVICSAVVQGRGMTTNLLGNHINLTRSEDGKLFANDAQVVRADVMATNGVLHVIDAVLVPDEALDMVSIAKSSGLTEFVNLLDLAGWTSKLQSDDNITVFVPTNEAVQALSPELVKQLTSDTTLLQSVLSFHVVPGEVRCSSLTNDRELDTLHSKAKLRASEYSSFPFNHRNVQTVQCASILTRNVASCNAIVHVIDRVLFPPRGSVMDVLAADSTYSTFVRLIKTAGMADSLQDEGPLTVFAPTNQAFKTLGSRTMQELTSDPKQLAAILNLHIASGDVCCSGIFHNPWWFQQRVRTVEGDTLFLTRNRYDVPEVSGSAISSCDNVATNGVVHGIDKVLLPEPDPWYMFR